jgi:O-acetyl-ADP-ribose deacetylase (regulator of RNase III)
MTQSWKTRVSLIQGDITDVECDAIVNAANNDLILGAGVAGAIRRKGGPQIEAECKETGSVPLGEAAVTSGGLLKARFVIHAASMRLGGLTSEEALRNSTRNSLQRAVERKLKSIAFPAIGTGIAGFPVVRCAEVMLEEVRDHLLQGQSPVEKILFVLFDSPTQDTFQLTLDRMSG